MALTSREKELLFRIATLQAKLHTAQRALLAAEKVLSRNAEEEGSLFCDAGDLYQIRQALKTTAEEG